MGFMQGARKKLRQGTVLFICLTLRPEAPFEILWLSVSEGERAFLDVFMDTCRDYSAIVLMPKKRVFE